MNPSERNKNHHVPFSPPLIPLPPSDTAGEELNDEQQAKVNFLLRYHSGNKDKIHVVESGRNEFIDGQDITYEKIFKQHVTGESFVMMSPSAADSDLVMWSCVGFNHAPAAGNNVILSDVEALVEAIKEKYNVPVYIERLKDGQLCMRIYFQPPCEANHVFYFVSRMLLEVIPTLPCFAGKQIKEILSGMSPKENCSSNSEANFAPLPFGNNSDSTPLLPLPEVECVDGEMVAKRHEESTRIVMAYYEENYEKKSAEKAKKKDKPSRESVINDMLSNLEQQSTPFTNQQGELFVLLNCEGKKMLLKLSSAIFAAHLKKIAKQQFNIRLKKQELEHIQEHLKPSPHDISKRITTFSRVGHKEGVVYVDIADNEQSQVVITSEDYHIKQNALPFFCRQTSQLPLPKPEEGGNEALLAKYFPGSKSNLRKAIVALLSWLGPFKENHLLVILGEQGSGKTSIARLLSLIIDPRHGGLRFLNSNIRDIAIAMSNGYLVAFDNLSRINTEISNLLCSCATGSTFSQRMLYTDSEETMIELNNPVILTGIAIIGLREDLLSRAMVIHLDSIEDASRITASELEKQFAEDLPKILGWLYSVVAAGLQKMPEIIGPYPSRMADCVRFAMACEEALGWEPGSVVSLYQNSQTESQIDSLQQDPFAQCLIKVVLENGSLTYSATEILRIVTSKYPTFAKQGGFPVGPSATARRLIELKPSLAKVGILVTPNQRTASSRSITITAAANAQSLCLEYGLL